MSDRVYLDWNATAPLRPEARDAMLAAMDVIGNPSSVHTEGRAAKAIVEKAREQVASLVGCAPDEVIFTSGATEAAASVLRFTPWDTVAVSALEHDCIAGNIRDDSDTVELPLTRDGTVSVENAAIDLLAVCAANGETGVVQPVAEIATAVGGSVLCDITQAAGTIPLAAGDARYLVLSAHKFGGPKGCGALIERGSDKVVWLRGGGQERRRRSGTENVVGIAGLGAAAQAAQRDLSARVWDQIAALRDDMEAALRDCAGGDLTIFGAGAPRLPNTSCFAVPGWKGETQVMQLDLAGFAVSAGSACSSGKTEGSRLLKAMGFDDITASSAIRVSMGPTTTKDEVSRFIDAWTALYRKTKTRAA